MRERVRIILGLIFYLILSRMIFIVNAFFTNCAKNSDTHQAN